MASPVKYYDYIEQVNKGVHVWGTHTFKIALGNTGLTQTHTVLADVTQIATGGGYTGGAGGGLTLDSVTLSETTGTAKVVIADEVLTATGAVATFRYLHYYNDTATSPADALVLGYDHGSAVTLANTETFTADHDATNGLWQSA
ncbi:MAG: hypothetical protein IPM06_17780 [Rhizobiales bacterium]|nr:hypothetical protein [Hyphomicrobiales bacterium]